MNSDLLANRIDIGRNFRSVPFDRDCALRIFEWVVLCNFLHSVYADVIFYIMKIYVFEYFLGIKCSISILATINLQLVDHRASMKLFSQFHVVVSMNCSASAAELVNVGDIIEIQILDPSMYGFFKLIAGLHGIASIRGA